MEFVTRTWTIEEYRYWLNRILIALICISAVALILAYKVVTADEKIILRTPGIQDTVFSKNTIDQASMKALTLAMAHAIGDINRGNYENQIKVIESWFRPEVATQLSIRVRQTVKKQLEEHEAGTQFFEFNPGPGSRDEYVFDPELQMHFVRGRLHFVNAAKDDARPIVFSFKWEVDNYLPKASEFYWEFGDVIKDSKYLDQLRKSNKDLKPAEEWSRNQDLNQPNVR